MRSSELFQLFEGVVIHDARHLLAYTITVAEAYDASPMHDPGADKSYAVLKEHNLKILFRQIAGSGVKVIFTPKDPYSIMGDDPAMAIRWMLYDMVFNKTLKIYSGHSDSHPTLSADDNVIFRTVHDYYSHGKLRNVFKTEIQKIMAGRRGKPTPEDLKQALPRVQLTKSGNLGHAFNLRGEMNSYVTHAKIAPRIAIPAFFTEIIGQASYNTIVGDFPQQKAVILPGFDLVRIGECLPGPTQQRMEELIQEINNGATAIKMNIAAKNSGNVQDLIRAVTQR
jgi:hypothetical protein